VRQEEAGNAELGLVAYRVSRDPCIRIVPAPPQRGWMAATDQGFARRCLPLLLANQAGWWLLNSHSFVVTWSGSSDRSGVHIHYLDGAPPYPAVSHFGHGLVTFRLPFLFRTPPGWNLLVRGPANMPKDGVAPLEGLVEADWSVATFTMNWQLTRSNHRVEFADGEPICMIVPVRRGDLEGFQPKIAPLSSAEDQLGYRAWRRSREEFLRDLQVPGSISRQAGWQRDYFLGRLPGGRVIADHQRRLHLQPFEEVTITGRAAQL
jgi:hypothetical protein